METRKGQIVRIVVAAVLLAAAMIVEHNTNLATWQLLLIYLIPYLTVGLDTLKEAVEGLLEGEVFDEDFLMAVATLGALTIGFLPGADNAFPEAVAVMLFFSVGELFEDYAEDRSRTAISHLVDYKAETATVLRGEERTTVPAEEVRVGDLVEVRVGEKLPVDGHLVKGATSLNTAALTGESLPREAQEGDEVLAGCINLTAPILLQASRPSEQSAIARIINMVENAAERKSRSESFVTRFARYYTPTVVGLAVLLAVVPPLISGAFASAFPVWLYRALMFLVVSCPCALVISVPLTYFAGLGNASRRGILIKGSCFIDSLSRLHTVVFDKTGTLTQGEFEVVAVHPEQCDESHLLHLAAHVEHYSTHPVAVALQNAYSTLHHHCIVENVQELAGRGMTADVDGLHVAIGGERLMQELGVQWKPCHKTGTTVHVCVDGSYAGHITLADRVKESAKSTIEQLRALGVKHTVMLTGDQEEVAAEVAAEVGVDEYHAALLPSDKLAHVERLMGVMPQRSKIAFVADGINDAPVIARADVGIAMGAMGSDAAIEVADVVLMDDRPSGVAEAVQVARRATAIAWQNVVGSIGVKLAVMVLGACGLATMWMAVVADVGVTVVAVLNAMRLLRKQKGVGQRSH